MEPKPNLIEVLHILKSKHYVVSTRSDAIKIFTAEPGSTLLQNQYIICRVAKVKIQPLGVVPPEDVADHPVARALIEKVGKTPAKRLFQYVFTPVNIHLLQRLDSGAEFYSIDNTPAGKPIIAHIAHLYYVVYISRSGKVYDEETEGGVKAYMLYKKGVLVWPQMIYVFRRDSHRFEIGVRIPLNEEQTSHVVSYLHSCQ